MGRLGAPKAITAAAHKLGRIVYHLMRHGEAYVREQEEAYAAEVRDVGEAAASASERAGVRGAAFGAERG